MKKKNLNDKLLILTIEKCVYGNSIFNFQKVLIVKKWNITSWILTSPEVSLRVQNVKLVSSLVRDITLYSRARIF